MAARVPTLEGRVVGLLNNSKSGTQPFLDRVEELLVLGHEHAAIAARQGFDKERARQTLFEHARIPFAQTGQSNADVLGVWRGNCIDEVNGQRTLRIVEKPEDILIVVAGGAGNHSASIPGFYKSILERYSEPPGSQRNRGQVADCASRRNQRMPVVP